LHPFVVEGD